MWNGNLLHGRYTHIMKFSIFIGEVESYLSSLIGTMQRIAIKKYRFLAHFYLVVGTLAIGFKRGNSREIAHTAN